MVWALATPRPYLQGEYFILHSDHASLRWLMDIAEPSGRLMLWRLRLSEFDFQVEYKKCKLNTQADALSRQATDGGTTNDIAEDIPCFMTTEDQAHPSWIRDIVDDEYDEPLAAESLPTPEILTSITPEELIREQHFDPFCSQMRSRLNGGELLPFASDNNGYFVRKVESTAQIVVPRSLRARVFHLSHQGNYHLHRLSIEPTCRG